MFFNFFGLLIILHSVIYTNIRVCANLKSLDEIRRSFYRMLLYQDEMPVGIPVGCFMTQLLPFWLLYIVLYTSICVPLFLSYHWMEFNESLYEAPTANAFFSNVTSTAWEVKCMDACSDLFWLILQPIKCCVDSRANKLSIFPKNDRHFSQSCPVLCGGTSHIQ